MVDNQYFLLDNPSISHLLPSVQADVVLTPETQIRGSVSIEALSPPRPVPPYTDRQTQTNSRVQNDIPVSALHVWEEDVGNGPVLDPGHLPPSLMQKHPHTHAHTLMHTHSCLSTSHSYLHTHTHRTLILLTKSAHTNPGVCEDERVCSGEKTSITI